MAGKKLLPEPEGGDSKGETLRQALERNDAEGARMKKALDEAMRAAVDPSVMRAMTAATQIGPRLEMARQAIQKMAPGMEAIDSMARHMRGILDSSAMGSIGRGVNEETNLTPLVTIEAVRGPEHYILEAQRDAVEAIIGMSALQQQSLTVMETQVEVLKKMQEDVTKQTRLTRWVLAAACAGIVVPVVIALVAPP
jgi:hypothetical protein